MQSISLYQDKKTAIHSMDPLNKIIYILTVISTPYILGYKPSIGGCILISLIILALAKVLRKTVPIISFSMIVILSIVIIQGIFREGNQTELFSIGPISFYQEGLLFALGIALNVINILLSFSILVLTTRPSDLVESLVKIGLSPKLGYVLNSVFQIIPQMTGTMATITDAQRSRGMETEGKLLTRLKAFFPLIAPVVMNSLIATKERAIALEVRGFNSKQKTFLNQRSKTTQDTAMRVILIGWLILALVWRIIKWLK